MCWTRLSRRTNRKPKKNRNRRKYPDSSELSRLEGGEGLRGHDYVSCLWVKSLQQACFLKKKLFKGGFLNSDLELKILTLLKSAWENPSVASQSGEVNSIHLTGLKTPSRSRFSSDCVSESSFPDKTQSSRADDCHVARWSLLGPVWNNSWKMLHFPVTRGSTLVKTKSLILLLLGQMCTSPAGNSGACRQHFNGPGDVKRARGARHVSHHVRTFTFDCW